MGKNNDREFAYQLPLQAKQTQPRENRLLVIKIDLASRNKEKIKTLFFPTPLFFSKLNFTPSFPSPHLPPQVVQRGCGMEVVVSP